MTKRQDASLRENRTLVNDCWNKIGVHGDGTCPELKQYIHCRNCPVYSAGAADLLDNDPPEGYFAEWTSHVAEPKRAREVATQTVVIFRVASEWLALPTSVVIEVANLLPIHSLPHRPNGVVLGLASVRGELLVCVSLGQVVGAEPLALTPDRDRGQAYRRLLVIRRDTIRVVCPVDEVHGIHRFHPRELKEIPTTVAHATITYSTALLPWQGHSVGMLDDQLLFYTLKRSLNLIEQDLSQFSMLDLFRVEAETQALVLTSGLLALEHDATLADQLEACMRAAHSLKGAARIVGLAVGVSVAHAMEDCFVAAQERRLTLQRTHIDLLLGATDLLARIAHTAEAEIGQWENEKKSEVDELLILLAGLLAGGGAAVASVDVSPSAGIAVSATSIDAAGDRQNRVGVPGARRASDRVLRVSAENLNRLLSLAGESLVESRWVKPFAESLLKLKREQHDLVRTLEIVKDAQLDRSPDDPAQAALATAQRRVLANERFLAERLAELEMFDRRSINLAHRLYEEALAGRMRPFADGVEGLPRMVRDLARSLGRQVKLDIVGGATRVDRDILAKLDAPLGHLLRNAIDHGLESPEARQAAGKSPEGLVRVEARHSAGALHIIVSDDGCGIDLEKLREAVVARNLTTREAARALSDAELLEFLFLPGFTMKATVTEVSGRGVGLDAVQDMVKQVRGTVRVSSEAGKGMRFQLQLPVTLSVVRTLLVDIAGEAYAFPLAYIVRTLKLAKGRIELLEGRQHFNFDGQHIGLITARQLFGADAPAPTDDDLPVIVVGDQHHAYGLVVDRFLGERELVVQPLDAQLGKIKDISAGALMEDGSPVLIVDAEDMIRSMDKLASGGRLATVPQGPAGGNRKKRKRVLVVDDSLTVRELERKLLGNRGYEVEVAVDGMDGWNAVRTGRFDLVVTDIDMPRMDGIELVGLITRDANLKSVPVMIVSYKDRDEDRQRGLEAGAAYYLTKGSFHDETLLQAVVDLIGEADA